MTRLRTQAGQSIVLLAFTILIIIAFVGLSIDTGNAMARQRKIQAGANAASLSGMNMVSLHDTDAAVEAAIYKAMADNGITNFKQVYTNPPWNDSDDDTVYFRAQYMDKDGTILTQDVGTQPNSIPINNGAQFVRVITSVDVKTNFSSVVGVPTYNVNARGIAGIGVCKQNVYPITFDQAYLTDNPSKGYVAPIISTNPDLPASTFPAESRFTVYRHPQTVGLSGNFLWLRWNGDQNNNPAGALANSLQYPGNILDGFAEAPAPTGSKNGKTPNELELGDWIAGDAGNSVSNDVMAALNFHISNKTRMILPVYDTTYGNGTNAAYHATKFVQVRLLNVSDLNGRNGYIEFGLVGENPYCPVPKPEPDPYKQSVKAQINEQLLWYKEDAGVKSYDLVIIQDYSASMGFKWDEDTYTGYPNRRIDSAIKTVNRFVEEMLVTRKALGADNRVAYITFGPNNKAQTVVNFTKNTSDFKSATGYGVANYKFPSNTVSGYTPTAAGLSSAVTLLNGARTQDINKNPVKLAVLLVTDGLANVFIDGSKNGIANTQSQYNCTNPKKTIADLVYLSDPYWQANCPTAAMAPGIRPPIIAAVEVAQAARTNKSIVFYAVVVGYQAGRTPEDLKMNLIAPNNYAVATNEAQLLNVIGNITQELYYNCTDGYEFTRPAEGATYIIRDKVSGNQVVSLKLDKEGRFEYDITPGDYTLEVAHTNVVAPSDILKVKRNYTRLLLPGATNSVPYINFSIVKGQNLDLGSMTLLIDDVRNAKCPNQ